MLIGDQLFDSLTEQAKASPRLRINYDLRTTPGDSSQRMLNAIEPDSFIPIHRHTKSTECIVLLRGKGVQYLYTSLDKAPGGVILSANGPLRMMVVEKGQWHRFQSLESGTVIFECKDGPYEPISEEDILK